MNGFQDTANFIFSIADLLRGPYKPNQYGKVVLVVRKTRLAELIERFNTLAQAKFYLTHAGLDFEDYQREDDAYRRSLDLVRSAMPGAVKVQQLDRTLVPTYLFARTDVVVALGQDGLVANTAKYAGAQWCVRNSWKYIGR